MNLRNKVRMRKMKLRYDEAFDIEEMQNDVNVKHVNVWNVERECGAGLKKEDNCINLLFIFWWIIVSRRLFFFVFF